MTRLVALLIALFTTIMPAPSSVGQTSTQPTVVDTFPHDVEAFTEGFDFFRSKLYEGTGRYGSSDLRRVDLSSGEVLRKRRIADKYFGEGIVVLGKRIFQLTWKEHTAFVYNRKTWKKIRRFTYEGEGWGLTTDGTSLIMSNGTSTIAFRDPTTFEIERTIDVKDGTDPVSSLNELEWVNGTLLANVWPTDDMVRIDPTTGAVLAHYDLSALHQQEESQGYPDVPNGIAYLPSEDRLFLTGKYWRHVYEVEL